MLDTPVGLPIFERRDELMVAIRDHQVIVVAGETGSGKSTQLPKLCLELGRGADALIGHTQPRRVAARTIAERIADETGTRLGELIGYSVRFTDRVGEQTKVRVMTDGILLADIQRDRMLRRYDTIIIDEAHERSLNIDFLLGYLRRLLPQRPDLKVIVTSATIDTTRFAAHFAAADGTPAPVIEVSGRTFPVEVRYRPYGEDPGDERDQVQAVLDAVDELGDTTLGGGNGDVLVFLSGEREIHDTADALRRRAVEQGRSSVLEVLPLYARLSSVEQHRIFQSHPGRRIVLCTNVAETSITVPGVRYVVDAGTARVSRYSHRLKVQRLPIEAVSQASADQRAGRCGRVAPGICVRLFAADDFEARQRFTEPEILRTNLASVILQMTALRLGDVADFPFLDPPDPRSVRDGYALLDELGAIESEEGRGLGQRRLTVIGTRLARLPIDPRLGRMVLEAERHGCVREVMVIAAALSIQDPRERPAEHRAAADELHRRFDVPGSDFLALVKLWDYLRERQQDLSGNQFRRMCRDEHLHYLRVREWQDLFSQLRQVAGQLGIRAGSEAGHPDRVHQSVLSGMLSHLGMRDGTTRDYRGAHSAKFALSPGTSLSKSLPKWVVAAELVETNRLWGRVAASVQPEWAESLAPHLVRRSYGDPWWDPRRGGAVCREQVMLYGLPIANRVVGLERVDPESAREHFIRCALVEGDWETTQPVIDRNRRFLRELADMSARLRRVDLVDDATVFAFYDARLGGDVVSGRHFDRWWKQARAMSPELLTMTLDDIAGSRAAPSADDFPTVWHQGELVLPVTYRFEPGAVDDGATVHVPLVLLGQVADEGVDWHVPGIRSDVVDALLRALPKEYRRELVPMADVVERVRQRMALESVAGSFSDALSRVLAEVANVRVPPSRFDMVGLDGHLRLRFSVHDGDTVIDAGRDLDALRARLSSRVRLAVARATPVEERRGITAWDIGDLPESVESSPGPGLPAVHGYPALLDDGDSVSIRVLSDPLLQARVMHAGVRRLLLLTVPVGGRALRDRLTKPLTLAIAASGFTIEDLQADCLVASADHLLRTSGVPNTADGFNDLERLARNELPTSAAAALAQAGEVCAAANAAAARLNRLVAPAVARSADDARAHLDRLVRPGFVATAGVTRLADVVRYVRGVDLRLAKLPENPTRDARAMTEVTGVESAYRDLLRHFGRIVPAEVVDLGWQLEELRVSTFAQSLGAARGVSAARLRAAIRAAAPDQ